MALARTQFPFLRLPRELRDEIYTYYVRIEDGYRCNFESNKLTTAQGQPIDLSLMHTCTQVFHEMQGLALANNTVSFYTFSSNETRMSALLWSAFNRQLEEKRKLMFALAFHFSVPDMINEVAAAFPQFQSLLEHWSRNRSQGERTAIGVRDLYSPQAWGEAPSTFRACLRYALKLFSTNPNCYAAFQSPFIFLRYSREPLDFHDPELRDPQPQAIIDLQNEPWLIPNKSEFTKMFESTGENEDYIYDSPRPKSVETVYSATSVAIRFLRNISTPTMLSLRNLVLVEDRQSIVFPQCHAIGLIPYCQMNQKLRIDRRVDLWQAMIAFGKSWGSSDARDVYYDLIVAMKKWFTEAQILTSSGMPPNSFTLTLEAKSHVAPMTALFAEVQQQAAAQAILDKHFAQKQGPHYLKARRKHACYVFEGFPALFTDIIEGRSFIRCNFPLGRAVDENSISERIEDMSLERLAKKYSELDGLNLPTMPRFFEDLKRSNTFSIEY